MKHRDRLLTAMDIEFLIERKHDWAHILAPPFLRAYGIPEKRADDVLREALSQLKIKANHDQIDMAKLIVAAAAGISWEDIATEFGITIPKSCGYYGAFKSAVYGKVRKRLGKMPLTEQILDEL